MSTLRQEDRDLDEIADLAATMLNAAMPTLNGVLPAQALVAVVIFHVEALEFLRVDGAVALAGLDEAVADIAQKWRRRRTTQLMFAAAEGNA